MERKREERVEVAVFGVAKRSKDRKAMKKRMNNNTSSTSISVVEASTNEPSSSPPSSAIVLFHKDDENGEQTLLPPNPNPNPNLDDGFYEIETIRRKRVRKVTKPTN